MCVTASALSIMIVCVHVRLFSLHSVLVQIHWSSLKSCGVLGEENGGTLNGFPPFLFFPFCFFLFTFLVCFCSSFCSFFLVCVCSSTACTALITLFFMVSVFIFLEGVLWLVCVLGCVLVMGSRLSWGSGLG